MLSAKKIIKTGLNRLGYDLSRKVVQGPNTLYVHSPNARFPIVKKIIKSGLDRLGYDLSRSVAQCPNNVDFLNLAILAEMQIRDRFFFIQVGANDGTLDDPLHSIIVTHHLKGVLIEPLPDKFAQLQIAYAGERQLRFENCALANQDGKCTFFRVISGAPYTLFAQGLGSFSKKLILKHGIRERHIAEISVPSRTFGSLIQKYGISDVSLLQVDTEGFDYEIIKMAFNYHCFPRIVHFEHCHLSTKDKFECWQTLVDNRYALSETGRSNTLAIRKQ